MRRMHRQCACFALLCALLLSACAGKQRSTRMTHADLDAAVEEMVASLSSSAFLNDRTADSPPLSIVINRVRNMTNDILTIAEQWMLVARVRGALPLQTLSQEKNIHFVITPERQQMLRDAGFDQDMGAAETPTHLMSATFVSSQRAARDKKNELTQFRSNYYYLEWEIIGVTDRERVWSDAFEFQREAEGRVID